MRIEPDPLASDPAAPPLRRGMRPAVLHALLAQGPGAWSRRQLVADFGNEALVRAIQSGAAVRLLPAIYGGALWAHEFETRVQAGSLWSTPQGLIGGLAAARVHGMLTREPRRITVALPRHAHPQAPPWVRLRRFAVEMKPDRAGVIRVVPVPDALIQAWEELPPGRGIGMMVDAVRERRTTVDALAARLAEYPRVRGRRELAQLLTDLRPGIDSYLEYLASTRVFNTAEFRALEHQVAVRAMGQRYVLDMFHRGAGVAVEFDGRKYHSDDHARRSDLERDANLSAVGIVTLRFTYEDIVGRPEWCRARVRQTLSARLGRGRLAPPWR